MKAITKYEVFQAHSSTNEKEISKAKREYRKQVKSGQTYFFDIIQLQFTDVNNKIKCAFVHPLHGKIGECNIN